MAELDEGQIERAKALASEYVSSVLESEERADQNPGPGVGPLQHHREQYRARIFLNRDEPRGPRGSGDT